MQRLSTSRATAHLRVVAQRPEPARPQQPLAQVARGGSTPAPTATLLRRLWNWLERPDEATPPSRPKPVHFYPQL